MIRGIERLGDGPKLTVPDLDQRMRIRQQIVGPGGVIARRDDDRSIGLIDKTDRHRSRQTCASTAGDQAGDLALEEEVVPDLVRGCKPDPRLSQPQRARCQALPSVWADGA